jgi:hypothetical protein
VGKRDWSLPKQLESSEPTEMTLDEAKAFRASLYQPEVKVLSSTEKREAFRRFWALNKSKYGKTKDIEAVLWVHLESMKMDSPDQFSEGLAHFGLKKTK